MVVMVLESVLVQVVTEYGIPDGLGFQAGVGAGLVKSYGVE